MWLWKQASVIGTPWITLQGGSPSKAPRGAAEHIINWGSQPREDRGEGATHSPGVSILTSDGLLPASSENWNWNWDNRLVGNITNKGRPPEKKWVTLSPWGGRGEVKRSSLFSPNLPGAEIVQKLTPGDNVTSFNRFFSPKWSCWSNDRGQASAQCIQIKGDTHELPWWEKMEEISI